MPKKKDKLSTGQYILTSILPFYGMFYYIRNRDEKPKASKVAMQISILVISILIVRTVIYQVSKKKVENLSGILQDKLSKFVDKSENKQYKGRLNLAYVSGKLSRKIKQATGLDYTGYEIFLYAKNVRHIQKRHPDISINDYYKLIDVLNKPQLVTEGYDKQGVQRIKIINQFDVKFNVITEIHIYKDYLTVVTMYKSD